MRLVTNSLLLAALTIISSGCCCGPLAPVVMACGAAPVVAGTSWEALSGAISGDEDITVKVDTNSGDTSISAGGHEHGGKIDPKSLPTGSNLDLVKAILKHFSSEMFTCGTCKDGLCEEHCPLHSDITIISSTGGASSKTFTIRIKNVRCEDCPRTLSVSSVGMSNQCALADIKNNDYGSGASNIKSILSDGRTVTAKVTRAGDVTYDGYVGLDDIVAIYASLRGDPTGIICPVAGDIDFTGQLDIEDVSLISTYLINEGPAYFVENYTLQPCTDNDRAALALMQADYLQSSKRIGTPNSSAEKSKGRFEGLIRH